MKSISCQGRPDGLHDPLEILVTDLGVDRERKHLAREAIGYGRVRRADPGIAAEAVVVEHRSRVVHGAPDVSGSEELQEGITCHPGVSGHADGELMEHMSTTRRLRRWDQSLDPGQTLRKRVRVRAAGLEHVVEARQLGDPESGLELGHAEVEPRAFVLVLRPLALVPDDANGSGGLVVVGRDRFSSPVVMFLVA